MGRGRKPSVSYDDTCAVQAFQFLSVFVFFSKCLLLFCCHCRCVRNRNVWLKRALRIAADMQCTRLFESHTDSYNRNQQNLWIHKLFEWEKNKWKQTEKKNNTNMEKSAHFFHRLNRWQRKTKASNKTFIQFFTSLSLCRLNVCFICVVICLNWTCIIVHTHILCKCRMIWAAPKSNLLRSVSYSVGKTVKPMPFINVKWKIGTKCASL